MLKTNTHLSKNIFFSDFIDKYKKKVYNKCTMIIQNVLLSNEIYTHENWVYKDIYTHFSRLYYILDGEAYYQEGERIIPLRKGYLYLMPVRKKFSLSENPNDKLLHTFAHITTLPPAYRLYEVEVKPDTCLYDAVMLWRKYQGENNTEQTKNILQLVLSCIEEKEETVHSIAKTTKELLDTYPIFDLTLEEISRRIGYSKIHINRVFFDAYKTTPIRYFNNRRMILGLKKLHDGVSVNEVSVLLNYSSPAAFSKAFKIKFGLSPEKYLSAL